MGTRSNPSKTFSYDKSFRLQIFNRDRTFSVFSKILLWILCCCSFKFRVYVHLNTLKVQKQNRGFVFGSSPVRIITEGNKTQTRIINTNRNQENNKVWWIHKTYSWIYDESRWAERSAAVMSSLRVLKTFFLINWQTKRRKIPQVSWNSVCGASDTFFFRASNLRETSCDFCFSALLNQNSSSCR